jgi:hypothetical protein
MFYPIVVMLKGAAGVVRWVDKDAFDFTGELLFEGLEGQQVVTEYKHVIENIVIGDAVGRVVRPLRVFEQNARLKPGPVLLPDPGEFKFGFLIDHYFYFNFLLYVAPQTQDETTDCLNRATHLPVPSSLPLDSRDQIPNARGCRECIA